MIPFLPSWVRSDMIYHEEAIEIQQLLGRGHYGCVYKGLFRNGKAVYVNVVSKELDTKHRIKTFQFFIAIMNQFSHIFS